MIYLNSRPIRKPVPSHMPKQKFEWRAFLDSDNQSENQAMLDTLRTRFILSSKSKRDDRYFLVPGRTDQISQLRDNETFEIRTLVETVGPLEVWETSVNSTIPMKRSLAGMIGAKIPRFSGAVTAAFTPDELTETLKKKSKFYRVKKKLKIFERGGVKAKVSTVHVNDNDVISIAFESEDAEPLLAELKAFGFKDKKTQNYGGYLTAM